jgi:hypothetical protein
MNRVSPLPWLLLAFSDMQALGQPAVVVSDGHGTATVDDSRFVSAAPLTGPWLFSPTDDSRYSDPALDDSRWLLVEPGPSRLLSAVHAPNLPKGQCWMRIHLHVIHPHNPQLLMVFAGAAEQYEVFANGKRIGATHNFGQNDYYPGLAFAMALPRVDEIVLAIHFEYPEGGVTHYLPLETAQVGQASVLGDRTDLSRYRAFENNRLADVIIGILYFGFGCVALTLPLAQRNQSEYLWVVVWCFLIAETNFVDPALVGGVLTLSRPVMILQVILTACANPANIEFALSLAGLRRT